MCNSRLQIFRVNSEIIIVYLSLEKGSASPFMSETLGPLSEILMFSKFDLCTRSTKFKIYQI